METTQKGNCKNVVNPEQKYIRIQIAGMAIFLSWPVAIYLAGYCRLNIAMDILTVLMVLTAVIVFSIGTVGKQELKEHNIGQK